MSDPLQLHRDGPVARLRMTRAEVHNAFDAALIAGLTAALDEVAADAAIRVLVLEAEGASFSAGADLHWMRGMAAASEEENRRDSLALARLMRTLDELPKPTIAAVQGAAFGGGVGLVACCDIAIGVRDAKFGLTESKLGWAVPLMRAGRQHTTQARCVITAHCDCGWDTPAYPTWSGLDADLADHRAAHRTGRCPAHLLDLIMEDI